MQPLLALGDEVTWRGRPLVGDRVQTLLAVLVEHAPETVSDERLIEELWSAALPTSPAKALQVVVSRARAMTDKVVVERQPAGYRLGTAEDDVDVLRIGALARTSVALLVGGDPKGAATLSRGALEIAIASPGERGPVERVRREARTHQRAARRILGLALTAQGEHVEALPFLVDAVSASPDDEELLAALLLAEAATAGPAAALTRFEAYRRDLAERLGSDPGPRLVRVHRQLLDADHPVRQGIRYAGTELLGRADDIRALSALIRTARVTSIIGPGGLGKTRLAHVIGATAVQSVVHFVELVGVTAPEDVVGEVGSALGVRDSVVGRRALTAAQRSDVMSQIAQQLDRTPTLLILDNCEHLIGAVADLVAQLVAQCPDLHVLTTSRSPLGIAAEHVYALAELDADDAADLFRLRARAARPGVVLRPEAVSAVVARLDGLPLAIELAAAKVRAMSVEDIERRLGDRFALLRGRDRSAPDRHQTLLAVIDWSWNLLAIPERAAFARLSVFHDGFTLAAAEAVVGPDALSSIEVLADQSLVVVRELDEGLRYRMLETVRDFGRIKLRETRQEAKALAAQRDWAVTFSKAQGLRLYGPEQVEALDALRGEEANLSDVLHRCLSEPDPEGVVSLISGLGGFWAIRGDHPRLFTIADAVEAALDGWTPTEHLVGLTRTALVVLVTNSTVVGVDTPRALGLLRRLGPGDEPTFTRAAIRVLLEVYGVRRDDEPPDAADAADLSLRLEAMGRDSDPITASLACQFRSHLLENSGDPQGALDAAATALELVTRADSKAAVGPWGEAMLHTQLAQLNAQFGRFVAAAEHAQKAAPVLERLEAVDDLLQARTFIAMAALGEGRIDDAERILDGHARYEGASLFGGGVVTGAARAEVAIARGDTDLALHLIDGLAVELERLRIPGVPALDGLEPWIVSGQAMALTVQARHGTPEGSRRYADALRHKVNAMIGGRTSLLDTPVLGMGFFALGVWGLNCATLDPDQAARLLAVADALAYTRLVPSLAWETAVAEAEEHAPGAVTRWQTVYAGQSAQSVVAVASEVMEGAGLAEGARSRSR